MGAFGGDSVGDFVVIASLILAVLNFVEFLLCFADWWHSPNAKTWWAALSWLGSTCFWVIRGVMHV
jgi:hypothetical protein